MIRARVIGFIIFFLFLFLFLNIFYLEFISGKKFRELGNKNCIRLLPQEGSRGRIFDRYGNIIVDNKLCYDVIIMPQDKRQIDKTLMAISKILGTDFEDLKNTSKNNFIASSAALIIAKDIDIKKAIILEESKSDINGVFIQPRPQRRYPHGRLAAHVLGYLNEIDRWRLTRLADYGYKTKDTVGFGGVEEKYDYYLRQEEGGLSLEVDSRGRFVRALGFRPPKNGKDIQLTLDLKIQKIVEENLADRKGCVILMEPYSGQIMAMASFPNFNPVVFVKKSSSAITNLFASLDAPLINRAIGASYPAGSVFKLIVATAALETGKINSATTFFCPGSIRIGREEFSCWDTHHQQNLLAAITHSCNVLFYRTGLLLGAQTIYEYALKFGFARNSSFDLPYETGGFVPHPLWKKIYRLRNWLDGDTVNLSIGQGELLVTPLQIARMMAIFANRGLLVTPHIIKAIDGRDRAAIYQKRILPLPIKEGTIDYIRKGLRNAVADPSGTANILSTLSVAVAGKTGTAQAPPGQPHAWFVGFFPFKNPKFVICVLLEHGGSGHYAAAIARQIIEEMIQEGLVQ